MADPLDPRIKRHISNQADGCWLWTGNINNEGYGRGRLDGTLWLAHRLVYTHLVGPIADGLILHHRPACPKNCVNPDHLELTTRSEHADARPAQLAARDRCTYGHEFDGIRRGVRYCRKCNARRQRETYKRRKEREASRG